MYCTHVLGFCSKVNSFLRLKNKNRKMWLRTTILPVSFFLCWLLGLAELLLAELGVPRALHATRCRRCDARSGIIHVKVILLGDP